MSSPVAVRTRLSGAQWGVLILLVLSVFINYIDRGNLSVAGPLLTRELALDPEHLGLLLSSFFWTYATFQIVAGWLVDRFNVNWAFAAGFFLWSGATAATGLVGGFAALFALRLLLGMGESIAYPAYSKILAGHFPEYHRGLANALIDAGSKLGPALGTLAGGYLMAMYGWRAFFIALGLVSLLWLVPWIRWMPRGRGIAAQHSRETPGIAEILKQRSAWGTFIGLFCGNYFWYFLLTWLPSYLVTQRHFSMEEMARVGSLAYFVIAITATAGGYVSDRWIGSGASPTHVRKAFTASGLSLATVVLPVAIVSDVNVAMALLLAACASFGLFTSNHWAVTQTLAGPLAAGKWTGLQNGFGNLAGIASPWLTGWLVKTTGSFALAFILAAAVLLVGAMSYLFVIGPLTPIAWKVKKDAV